MDRQTDGHIFFTRMGNYDLKDEKHDNNNTRQDNKYTGSRDDDSSSENI